MRNRVFLIAGHTVVRGKGTGAHGFIDEAVEAVRIQKQVAGILRELNVRVVEDDETWTLRHIVNWILGNKPTENDIVFDIHFNASTSAQATGTEVWIPTKFTAVERAFAEEIAKGTAQILSIPNRGVKLSNTNRHGRLAILDDVPHAIAALWEVCFVTNKKDVESYNNNFDTLCRFVAKTIYEQLT